MQGVDAIVVGGGIAGLTSAVALAEEGSRVLILERSRTFGGRAQSFIEPHTGHSLPIGPHVFLDNYANLLALLDRLGTREHVLWDGAPELTVTDGARALQGRLDWGPPPFHFWPALVKRPDKGPLEILANLPALLFSLQVDERAVLELDQLDAATVLRWLGVPASSQTSLWSFMGRSILNVPLDRCSAGSLFRFSHYALGSRAPRFGYADRGLGELFAPAASRLLPSLGSAVRTGCAVRSLLFEDQRVVGVELHDGTIVRSRFVIVTAPGDALSAMLPARVRADASLAFLRGFEPSPYVSVFLWFDRKLTRRRFWARSFRPGDFGCDFYDLSNIYRGWDERPSLVAANIIYSHRVHALDDREIAERIRSELSEFFPAAARERMRHWAVRRIPMAIACPLPGFEGQRPLQATRFPGLYLAGDATRTGLPSSMESAARSGWLAAEGVLAELGRKRTLARPLPPVATLPRAYARAARALPVQPARALLAAHRTLERLHATARRLRPA